MHHYIRSPHKSAIPARAPIPRQIIATAAAATLMSGCASRPASPHDQPSAAPSPTASDCRPADPSILNRIKRGERRGASTLTPHTGSSVDQPGGATLVAMSFTLDSHPNDPPKIGVWRIKGPETFAVTEPAILATSWSTIAANENAVRQAQTCLSAANPS